MFIVGVFQIKIVSILIKRQVNESDFQRIKNIMFSKSGQMRQKKLGERLSFASVHNNSKPCCWFGNYIYIFFLLFGII